MINLSIIIFYHINKYMDIWIYGYQTNPLFGAWISVFDWSCRSSVDYLISYLLNQLHVN